MKLLCTVFLMGMSFLHAYDLNYIAQSIKKVAAEKYFDVKVIYTLAQIESGFKPFKISMLTHPKNAQQFKKAENERVKVEVKNYFLDESLMQVSFHPQNLALSKSLVRVFKKQKLNFDVGLMQINSNNFGLLEIDSIFEPKYNISKAMVGLNFCSTKFQKTSEIIECYNSGTKLEKRMPYYKYFVKKYKKNFGDK